MQVSKIAVVGAGQMGRGIAQVAAQSGFQVYLSDISTDSLKRAEDFITKSLEKLHSKSKISEKEFQDGKSHITYTTNMSDLADCDLIIEAATENKEIKFQIFKELDELAQKDAILASNTSSISITEIAEQTSRPDKVAGMHFMNPVPIMVLVEAIRGKQTSDQTFQTIKDVAEKMGKTFVSVNDAPGFAVNRILMPMINEAVFTLHQGIASVQDIDQAMKLGTNQPMGPLTLADFIGLDTCLAIMEVLHEGFKDDKYTPCPLLKEYVNQGWLGRKSGRGFYEY